MVYFTSDLHLGHENVIKLCNRPFDSIEEMDEALIHNWNRKVTNRDTVYVLGDLIYKKQKAARRVPSAAERKKAPYRRQS